MYCYSNIQLARSGERMTGIIEFVALHSYILLKLVIRLYVGMTVNVDDAVT